MTNSHFCGKKKFINESFGDENLYRVYLEDPSLLFEVLILIRLSIREVVDLDTMFINLIQNLTNKTVTVKKNTWLLPIMHLNLFLFPVKSGLQKY